MRRLRFALLVLLSVAPFAAAAEGPPARVDLSFHSPLVTTEARLPVLPDDPELARRLELEAMEEARSFLREVWEEALDPDLREAPTSPWRIPRELRRTVTLVYESARLSALRVEIHAYTGGAHGLHSLDGLLWDRRERRFLGLADLLDVDGAAPALLAALGAALRREKARRGYDEEVRLERTLLEEAGVVVEAGRDGRACGLRFLFSPYLVGAYVEGSYEVVVPTAVFTRWLRRRWRETFADCDGTRGDAAGGPGRLDFAPDAAR